MTIADQINRLNNAKANIKQAIENKGVEVSDSALLDEYPALISSIEVGSGEGGDPFYEDLYNLRTSNGTNMSGLFSCYTAPELDLSNLDISKVDNMSYMFYRCSSSVNVDGWDTSKVINMSYMFYYFSGSIDFSKLDTSNVTNVKYMFSYASGTTLDLSSWDISNITNMDQMFTSANYKKIDLTGWNTSNVTSVVQMFYGNMNLEELIIPDWDMTKVTSSTYFLSSVSKLKFVDLSRSNDATIAKIASFLPKRTATTSGTVLVPANTSQEVCDTLAAKYWTAQKPEVPEEPPVEDIPLYEQGEFAMSDVTEVRTMVNESHTDLSEMFLNCSSLASVNTEDWNTSNVAAMNDMFAMCSSLETLDLSSFDTSKVTTMEYMFYMCSCLEILDIRNFNMDNVTNYDYMFTDCTVLHTLHLNNCNRTTISKIINAYNSGVDYGPSGTIYCKEAEAAGLTPPKNWVFSYVD